MADPLHSFDPDHIARELERMGTAWADRQAAASALERAAKTMHGKCFLEATGNIEERKVKASLDPEYIQLQQSADEATHIATKSKVLYDTYRTKAELLRTLAANQRALANLR